MRLKEERMAGFYIVESVVVVVDVMRGTVCKAIIETVNDCRQIYIVLIETTVEYYAVWASKYLLW
jgi:hypothetical protein